jgi:DNA-binding response OmpR family regulator
VVVPVAVAPVAVAVEAAGITDITFGPFTIDLAASRVLRDGAELRMRPQAFHVLRRLAAHGGRFIDGDQLIREAWAGTNVTRHTVHVTIAEVRRILSVTAIIFSVCDRVRASSARSNAFRKPRRKRRAITALSRDRAIATS